jgi:energy-coupling factor transporter ATP-binding protein EcfA2
VARSLLLEPDITFVAGRNDVGKSALLRAMRLLAAQQEGARAQLRVTYAWRIPSATLWEAVASEGPPPEWEAAFAAHDELTLEAWFGARGVQPESGLVTDLEPVAMAVPGVLGRATGSGFRGSGWRGGQLPTTAYGVESVGRLARSLAAEIVLVDPRAIELNERNVYPKPVLEPSARNLTDVLVYLRNREPRIAERLTRFMRSAFPQIEDVVVPPSTEPAAYSGAPTVYYEGARERRVPLRHCGAGVAQILALAVAIMSTAAEKVILIDEPQAYLHIADAVLPVPVRMLFVFDPDEKSEDDTRRIRDASRDRAVFLPVREIENYFLRARSAIAAAMEVKGGDGASVDEADVRQGR